MKMWKFSNARGLRMALIPCICLGARTLAVFYPTLYRCGVLHRLFLHRSFHNLHTDKRDRLHTFCLFTPTILELWLFLISTFMRFITSDEYIAPDVYIVEAIVETGFAGSTLEDIEEERPEIGW